MSDLSGDNSGSTRRTESSKLITNDSNELFNEDLSAAHSYLGENLEEVSGRMIYTERRTVKIPLLTGYDGTLLPGQSFPLTVRDFTRTEMLRSCVAGDRTFGCIATRHGLPPHDIMYGTTAEIYEYSDEMGTICIKAKGRQRFKLLQSNISTNSRFSIGEVYILPDVKLQNPFSSLQINSLNHLRIRQKEKCRRIESNFFIWPKWVYDMYDVDRLMKQANGLTFLKQGLRAEKGRDAMPKDPIELSWYIASHLDTPNKLFVITINSAIPRLRWLLSVFKNYQVYVCCGCGQSIGKQSDVFAMSIEGAQTTYVNSQGYHHDTFTLLKTTNMVPVSSPVAHYSWFPGYAWSIAVCQECQMHLGWQFIASTPKLVPSRFWGLSRGQLVTRFENPTDGHQNFGLPTM